MSLDPESSPTAQTFDYMKQALDDKIGTAINSGERGQARLYQGLKSDLVGAIDNHPDPNVAGVWQQARQAWSDPTSIISARQDGASALSRGTNVDELREQFQNYSPPEQQAFLQGVRGNVADVFAAIPGAVGNYVRNFAIDRPGTWFGMSPGDVIGQHEAGAMATARSQLAPILTMPNGPNADLANALLGMAGQKASRAAVGNQANSLATALISGPGSEEVRRRINPHATMWQLLIGGAR